MTNWRRQGGRKGPTGQPGTTKEAPGRQERTIGRHQGGSREAGKDCEAPGRHQGGSKGPIGQPGRHQGLLKAILCYFK